MDFSQNYFQLFGMVEAFEIDSQALTARYRELQKTFHPDRFVSAPDQERRLALQQAAHVNSGHETLRDPLARARYLLSLRSADYCDETSTINDPEFLEEQMDLRESLAEIRFSGDAADALLGFMKQLKAKDRHYLALLSEAFAPAYFDASQVKGLVQRMQFVRKLQQEAEALEEDLML